jgi:hypothetical protein
MTGERLAGAVSESNRQARDAWDRWAAHRDRVMGVIEQLRSPGGSLCILGPGTLNDVDVSRLSRWFAAVHLVDLDVAAVRRAMDRRRAGGGIHLHPRTDLSGILDRLEEGDARGALDRLPADRPAVAGRPFDVTVSTGLLTQMLQSVVDAGLAEADAVRVALALRDKHLRDLVLLTRPGGAFALISDVVASTTAPRLADVPDPELEPLMAELVAAGNFFTATNPYRIVALLEADEHVDAVRLLDPWRWPVTRDRVHLVYAIVGRRAAARSTVREPGGRGSRSAP